MTETMNAPAKPVLKKREQILIVVDGCSDLTVLSIISAIQAYETDGKRKHDSWCHMRKAASDFAMSIDLVMPNSARDMEFMFRTLISSVREVFYVDLLHRHSLNIEIYDCIFELNEERARRVAAPTQKHLAQAYGIMLGSEASALPHSVENLCQGHTSSGKILTSFEYVKLAAVHLPLPASSILKIEFRDRIEHFYGAVTPIKDRIQKVFECSGVIDILSFETHLASCLGKTVLELNTDSALTKWSAPNYYSMKTLTKAGLEKGYTLCFPELLQE